jgi:hydroxymethylpyrimidine/phosphomethylpyrimidine kinase
MYPHALTIAGSDSGGGAGIQADLKAFSALGVYGASVVTALTAQNTREVSAIHDVPPGFVAAQIDAVFNDIRIDAVKIGMLSQPAIIDVVAERLIAHQVQPIVLDPVMVAKSGAALLAPAAVAALRERLLPLATVITPNLPEAAVLLGQPEPRSDAAMADACAALRALGPRSVVLKGGHAGGAESVDYFYDGSTLLRLPARRVPTRNTHGTGCTFSAAIAAFLSRGDELAAAVQHAKQYTSATIAAADQLSVGSGHGPVHHFYAFWNKETDHE